MPFERQIYSLLRHTFCAASPRDGDQYVVLDVLELFELVCAVRFERTTPCAQDTCATTALRTEVVGGVWVRACMMGVEYTQNLERVVGVEPNSTQFGKLVSHLGLTRNWLLVVPFIFERGLRRHSGDRTIFTPTRLGTVALLREPPESIPMRLGVDSALTSSSVHAL